MKNHLTDYTSLNLKKSFAECNLRITFECMFLLICNCITVILHFITALALVKLSAQILTFPMTQNEDINVPV